MGLRVAATVAPVWLLYSLLAAGQQSSPSAKCIDCHTKLNAQVVSEWKESKHSQKNVDCVACHGDNHTSADDVANVRIARPDVCVQCHKTQVEQDRQGRHARAGAAMKTIPNFHWRAMAETVGQESCVGCHRTGSPKNPAGELLRGRAGGIESGAAQLGGGACDSCHSRHRFSVEEARSPQVCQRCHAGAGSGEWAAYRSSAHGILNDLKERKLLPAGAAAPTCQTCHMPGGDHGVNTAWGPWNVRLPMPDDPQWTADRTDIMRALNIFDAQGRPMFLMDTIKSLRSIRFSHADWQQERDKMIVNCSQCHSQEYARRQLQQGDDVIRTSDHLLAEAIRVVAGLYKDGLLPAPQGGTGPFPWLTSFDPPSTIVEDKLRTMYFEHRKPAFQGIFHSNPAFAVENGLAKMQRDLVEIKELAADVRRTGAAKGARPAAKAGGRGEKRRTP